MSVGLYVGSFSSPAVAGKVQNFDHAISVPGQKPTLNAPAINAAGTANQGDNVAVTASTSDSDGATTTGVQLVDGGVSLGAMVDGGGGSWTFTINGIASGTHALVARRQTAQGNADSPSTNVVVSGGAPAATGVVNTITDPGPDQDKIETDNATGDIFGDN